MKASYYSLTASQHERDYTKCFTVVNGSQEVFNVLGSGRLVTQGEIGCRRVYVHVDPNTIVWPDYVFADRYQTPSWQELETHLKEKKHLPGIPTAEEVACEGLDLAKVNAQLLEQIEILNLRVLELNRRLESLEQPSR